LPIGQWWVVVDGCGVAAVAGGIDDQALDPFGENTRSFRYWEETELVDLVTAVGLEEYQRNRARMFIMFTASKPCS
jgi:hypothetical protein